MLWSTTILVTIGIEARVQLMTITEAIVLAYFACRFHYLHSTVKQDVALMPSLHLTYDLVIYVLGDSFRANGDFHQGRYPAPN